MALRVNSERKGISLSWDETFEAGFAEEVTVYATGEEGDVHNKLPQKNNGEAGVFYPASFTGESLIEVRSDEGTVVSETISV
jgi:hypothetical protein